MSPEKIYVTRIIVPDAIEKLQRNFEEVEVWPEPTPPPKDLMIYLNLINNSSYYNFFFNSFMSSFNFTLFMFTSYCYSSYLILDSFGDVYYHIPLII